MPKIRFKVMNVFEALEALGYDIRKPVKGKVMVKVGPSKFRYYSFRLRIGDGHAITIRGRLTRAEATYIDGELSHIAFEV